MKKWFRFIRKGHLMMVKIGFLLKELSVQRDEDRLRLDAQEMKVREAAAMEGRLGGVEGFQLSILERLSALEARPVLVPKEPKREDIVKTRTMSQFRKLVEGDIEDVSQGKIG